MGTYRVPLPTRDIGHLYEEPLSRNVFETRLDNTQFHSSARVDQDLRETGCASGTNLTPDTFSEVDDSRPDGEPPALVAKTMLGAVEGEGSDVVGIGRVTDEATSGMGVEADHEEEREMVSVPEGLEALVSDFVVSGRVHEDHDEEHEVACDTASLSVVNIQRPLRTNLCNERSIRSGIINNK